MPSARKSAPPKTQAKAKRTAVPHGPSEGKGKPAASKAPAKVKTAPAKKASATRTTRGGAAASKPALVTQSAECPHVASGKVDAGSIPAPGTTRPTAELTPWEAWKATPDASLEVLCDHIVAGGHLAEFVKTRGFSYTSMLRWLDADPARAELYARAREDRSDKLADELVAISDEAEVAARYDGEDVKLGLDAAAVARNRLRVDARKWVAAKLKPRVYGEKLDLTANVNMPSVSDADLLARLAKFGVQVKLDSHDSERETTPDA